MEEEKKKRRKGREVYERSYRGLRGGGRRRLGGRRRKNLNKIDGGDEEKWSVCCSAEGAEL